MKRVLGLIFFLILSVAIVIGLPIVIKEENEIQANISNEVSLVKQEIISYGQEEKDYNKLYADGKLIGVVSNLDYLNNLIKNEYSLYENDYPNTELGLSNNVYIAKEKSFIEFENVDDKILKYLVDNDLLGIKATSVEFSTSEGVYEIIYVKNIEDFYSARQRFLLNFVSEDTIKKLNNKEQISSPSEVGEVEMNVQILENIQFSESIVSPNDIFSNENDIYNFLCYGRNEHREYYTVQQGDTLQSFYHYFGINSKQIVSINSDILKSENQVITPGMKINVTYFTSPITVLVTKQVLSQSFITPDSPEYIEDENIESGKMEILTPEVIGIQNTLFEEKWVNGVLKEGNAISKPVTIKEPVQGKIAVGTKEVKLFGTGNYVWPIDNPKITCDYGGYPGHTGTDFVNKYGTYVPIYAVDSGTVDETGYSPSDMGYYIKINHQNGIRTFYMHLSGPAYLKEGENVHRGQIIGEEGNTGESTGPHLHFVFEINHQRVDSCDYLPCYLIR